MQPEALSRWTPAVSTRCSWLALGASLSSSRSETDARHVAASPREMWWMPERVRDLPLLLSRAELLQRRLSHPSAYIAGPRSTGDVSGVTRRA